MNDKPIKTAASGRIDVYREADPGQPKWIHRWMGDEFLHMRGDASSGCLCQPYYVPAGDTRTLDEIVDDIEAEESTKNS